MAEVISLLLTTYAAISFSAGEVITSVVNYRSGNMQVHKASGRNFKPVPLAVLVNGFSASASEITAGCVKDHGVGVIIGEKTFGKGSVQTIRRLAGGGAIKYTTAHYLTPNGTDINKLGIHPDIEVKMDKAHVGTNRDTQLERAVTHLTQKITKGN
jgi:carboxyl-terminal processing protease